MDRRAVLALLGVGLAGCTGGNDTEAPPSSTATQTGTREPTGSATPAATATEAGTETSDPKGPAVIDSSITPEQDYRGDAIPMGSTLTVAAEFDVWAHEGTAEGTVNIRFDPMPKSGANISTAFEESGSELVVQEYSTTINTAGWTAGEYLAEITVSDSVFGATSLPNEHSIRIAEYTQTEYRVSAEGLEEAQALLDEGIDAFAPRNQTILDIKPESTFDPQSVNQPLNEADQVAREVLNDDVDPFVAQLEQVSHFADIFEQLADFQHESIQNQNTLVGIDHTNEDALENFEEELEANTGLLDDLDSEIQSGTDYPLPVEEKLSAFRTDVSNLSGFVPVVEDLRYAAGLLDDGQGAEENDDYSRAESLAIDASREFESVLQDLEEMSVLPDTTEEFTNRTEDGLGAARDLRDSAARRQE